MTDQIVLLLLGFVLTTIFGGGLGYYYQRRTWDASRRESERAAAASVFDEISRAMDERLYRMRLVYWALKQGDEGRLDSAMNEYRSALTKWNDSLNRNLALAERYFGNHSWFYLSGVFYEEFAVIGRHLEARFREWHDADSASGGLTRLYISGRRLQALSNDIFALNRFMISMIQRGQVGLYLQNTGEAPPWLKELGPGSTSTQVANWQRDLVRCGYGPLDVDGWFGMATRDATTAFQLAAGLDTTGIVRSVTKEKMAEIVASASSRRPD